jgi:hypothetical protein
MLPGSAKLLKINNLLTLPTEQIDEKLDRPAALRTV